MWRCRLSCLAVGAAALAACGDRSAAERYAEATKCPPGTPKVGVQDILPKLPAGTVLVRPREDAFAPIVERLTRNGGTVSTQTGLGLVVTPGNQIGTGVIVANSKDRTDDEREMILATVGTEPEPGVRVDHPTVAGRAGILSVGSNGAMLVGSVGRCALVILFDERESPLRRVADRIQQPQ